MYKIMFLPNKEEINIIKPEQLDSKYYKYLMASPTGTKGKSVRKMRNLLYVLQENNYFPDFTSKQGSIYTDGGSFFIQIELKNGQTEFLNINKVTNYKTIKNTAVLPQFEKISYVFGPCLFSCNAVQALSTDGTRFSLVDTHANIEKKIKDVVVDKRITPYELCNVMGLTHCIAQLINNNKKMPHQVFVNVPMVEYYLYVLNLFKHNLVHKDVVIKWFDCVDERSVQIRQLCTSQIKHNCNVDATYLNVMDSAKDFIRCSIESGKTPSVSEIINSILHSDVGHRFSKLINSIIGFYKPETYQSLDNVVYVASYMLCSNIGLNSDAVLYAVDRFAENKIVRAIKKCSSQLQLDPYIYGVYPIERVIENDCRSIYRSDIDGLENSSESRKEKLEMIEQLWSTRSIEEIQLKVACL